jgi:putative tryptophan/tyrosine transport system substrate-binding protein
MRRRKFLALAGAAAAWPLAARAQTSGRVARVGFLTPTGRVPVIDAFALKLRDLGWIEGQNLHVEQRFAENDESRLPALASELVDLHPDVIVTVGPAVLAAHLATSVLPIVVAGAADLVAYGMVASLAHPGGNITGELVFLAQYVAKRLEFLKGVAPSLTRAGVLLYRASPVNAEMMRVATSAARALRVELSPMELGEVGEFESAFPPSSPIGGFVTTDHRAQARPALGRRRG